MPITYLYNGYEKNKTIDTSLENLFSTLGIRLDEKLLPVDTGLNGLYCEWVKEKLEVILLNPSLKGEARRYTLAHEIGHALIGEYSSSTPLEKVKEAEMQANVFAAVLLALLAEAKEQGNAGGLICERCSHQKTA